LVLLQAARRRNSFPRRRLAVPPNPARVQQASVALSFAVPRHRAFFLVVPSDNTGILT
jgi:hypothetical protein